MSYKTVYSGGEAEVEVKRSRFIATVQPVSSEAEAQEFLASIRKRYHDATHNCYACTVGSRFELQRSSDDGEPGGTAGRPILEVLLQEEIHDCIVVVTRYFGGTLLGTGGLIRAYQTAAKEGLAHSVIAMRCLGRRYTIRTDYGDLGRLQSLVADEGIPVMDSRYSDVVEMDLIVPEEREEAFLLSAADITAAKARIIPGETAEYAVCDGEVFLFEREGGNL